MTRSYPVFRAACEEFSREKGMLLFYGLSIAITGIIIPILTQGIEASLTIGALLTAILLRPLLSDSLAGEREHRTLETLLSSPLNGKSIIWRKLQFCCVFAVSYFTITVFCSALSCFLVRGEPALLPWQWLGIMGLAVLNYSAICIAGVYASSTSGDMRAANSRVSWMAYPLGLLFVVCLGVIATADWISAMAVGAVCALIYLSVLSVYSVRVTRMKQPDFFKPGTVRKPERVHKHRVSSRRPKSQFGIVLKFEWKALMTLKSLLLSFGLLCFSPVAAVCLLLYFTGTFDLNYAVILTVLLIPRVPSNLIAYSIGGEKVYKTGESLLSTPLQLRPVLLAKCTVPVLVTAVMLAVSALLTWAGSRLIPLLMPDLAPIPEYTASQLILLFSVSILSSISMILIAAILSVRLQTPRHGLYATSLLSFLFVLPVLAILYLAPGPILWTLIYSVILLLGDLICLMKISDNITRPQVMSRL
ncbi:ABC transporter permease family protein [Paenibacillus riograndensis]|uniref:Putative membrane protein n=1 Tax=Paenibacillus riograndensis SBR5 TaxID=1073571 RepID=A0A0E4HEV9_9BACL|nr:ABC transporter permease [Paenibacillus riograndensis]CQR56377.1 putative membrane protein [Paenibacillus riograndensis SBR5]